MNAKTQQLLSGIAQCAGLTLEFPNDAPVRISGFQHDDSPFVLISTEQPDSELIFALLQEHRSCFDPERDFLAPPCPLVPESVL